MNTTDFGSLAPIVKGAGALIAMVIAIILAWKGRAKWEPSEEDIPGGPQKVAGLVSAVIIGIAWYLSTASQVIVLSFWAIGLAVFALIMLVVYGYLVSSQTFTQIVIVNRKPREKKVIGGFRLTDQAARIIKKEKTTTQQFFKGTAYDPDMVWTRPSRSLAKSAFVVSYVGLIVGGTLALALAAIIISFPKP